jgi:hypothetical protein
MIGPAFDFGLYHLGEFCVIDNIIERLFRFPLLAKIGLEREEQARG